MRFALFLLPLLILAGCGGGGGGNSAAPVAAVQAPAGTDWLSQVRKTPDNGYMQGNPNAPIKLVEYGSRTCPVCGAFYNTGVEPLRAKYISTGKVSYEFRDFWVHPQDPGVSLLGHCVPTEAYFTILDQMYAAQSQLNARAQQVYEQIQALPKTQQPAAWVEALGYLDFMKQRGVPEAKARACVADPALLKELTDVMKKGADQGVEGTPTFFINGKVVPNVVTFDGLEPALQSAGAR